MNPKFYQSNPKKTIYIANLSSTNLVNDLKETEIDNIKELNFKLFIEYIDLFQKYCLITVNNHISSYKDLSCSCRMFLKNKKCEHIYSLLSNFKRLNMIETTVLSVKKKRGRPNKIVKNRSLSKN